MARLQRRSFAEPEETRRFPHGDVSTVSLDDVVLGRYRLEPGWRWSNDVKPIAGTAHCQHRHIGYALEGHLHVVMKDGATIDVMAGDAYEIPPGHDAWVVGGETYLGVEFSGARTFGVAPRSLGEEVLATLVFTDIAGSTAMLSRVGDAAWREILLDHNAALRLELERHRGRELKTTGDGFLFAFDSATRAVRCAQAMVAASRSGGLGIRAGCHTGEVQLLDGDARGVAVHTAARIMDLAAEGEVLMSWTTRELLAGSDISVASAGVRELKGLVRPLEVFRAD
jgi:class 3 adenylate cyclase